MPAVLAHLRALDAADIAVILGGIIPDADRPALMAAGVRGIFGPGTPLAVIADEIRRIARERDEGVGADAELRSGVPL